MGNDSCKYCDPDGDDALYHELRRAGDGFGVWIGANHKSPATLLISYEWTKEQIGDHGKSEITLDGRWMIPISFCPMCGRELKETP